MAAGPSGPTSAVASSTPAPRVGPGSETGSATIRRRRTTDSNVPAHPLMSFAIRVSCQLTPNSQSHNLDPLSGLSVLLNKTCPTELRAIVN